MTKNIKITEVGPRDGLQNESKEISVEQKVEFIKLLSESGLNQIEAGSFVSPKWVPQMANSDQVFHELQKNKISGEFSALVPNLKGLERALDCGVKKIAVFTAASESFNQKNINCSIEESFQKIEPVVTRALEEGLHVRGYLSTAFYCPYEGHVKAESVTPLIQQLSDLGVHEISIGDTIGKALPNDVTELLTTLDFKTLPEIVMHFHDTYDNALENIKASLEQGVRHFDSSTAGLGGCPYAPGAKGNVSTRSVVECVSSQGYSTTVDLDKLKLAEDYIVKALL